MFCSIKCWIEFDFDQTLICPTILLDDKMLQCFAALPTKFFSWSESRGSCWPITNRYPIFRPGLLASFATKMADEEVGPSWLLMNSQRARRERWWTARVPGEESLEGFQSRNFEQMTGSIAFKILRTTQGSFSSFPKTWVYLAHTIRSIINYRLLLVLFTVCFPRLTPSFAFSNSSSTINTASAFGFRVGTPCFQI